jgi:hypothetical protein
VTLSGGRANRGRFYWPGGVDTQIDSAGFLDTTAVSNWETAMADLLTQLQTDLLFPVILHGGAAAPTTIVDFVLQSQAATQRRRLRG